jgi:hypothetical protein
VGPTFFGNRKIRLGIQVSGALSKNALLFANVSMALAAHLESGLNRTLALGAIW